MRSPVEQVALAERIFGELGLSVDHFAALWHVMKVGEAITTDLNRVAAGFGVSIADFHCLSALRMEHPAALRPSDLTQLLHISFAGLTPRLRRLADAGWIVRQSDPSDRRATMLFLTHSGMRLVHDIGLALETQSTAVAALCALPVADRGTLSHILAELHCRFDRDFLPEAI